MTYSNTRVPIAESPCSVPPTCIRSVYFGHRNVLLAAVENDPAVTTKSGLVYSCPSDQPPPVAIPVVEEGAIDVPIDLPDHSITFAPVRAIGWNEVPCEEGIVETAVCEEHTEGDRRIACPKGTEGSHCQFGEYHTGSVDVASDRAPIVLGGSSTRPRSQWTAAHRHRRQWAIGTRTCVVRRLETHRDLSQV